MTGLRKSLACLVAAGLVLVSLPQEGLCAARAQGNPSGNAPTSPVILLRLGSLFWRLEGPARPGPGGQARLAPSLQEASAPRFQLQAIPPGIDSLGAAAPPAVARFLAVRQRLEREGLLPVAHLLPSPGPGQGAASLAGWEGRGGVGWEDLVQAVDSVMAGLSAGEIGQLSHEEFHRGAEKILALLQGARSQGLESLRLPGAPDQSPSQAQEPKRSGLLTASPVQAAPGARIPTPSAELSTPSGGRGRGPLLQARRRLGQAMIGSMVWTFAALIFFFAPMFPVALLAWGGQAAAVLIPHWFALVLGGVALPLLLYTRSVDRQLRDRSGPSPRGRRLARVERIVTWISETLLVSLMAFPLLPAFVINPESDLLMRLSLAGRGAELYALAAGAVAALIAISRLFRFRSAYAALKALLRGEPPARLSPWLALGLSALLSVTLLVYAYFQPLLFPSHYGKLSYRPAAAASEGLRAPSPRPVRYQGGEQVRSIEEARHQALAYLLGKQDRDGSWGGEAEMQNIQFRAAVTAIAMDALKTSEDPRAAAALAAGNQFFAKNAFLSPEQADPASSEFWRHIFAPYVLGYGLMHLLDRLPHEDQEGRAQILSAVQRLLSRAARADFQYSPGWMTPSTFQMAVVGHGLHEASLWQLDLPRSKGDPDRTLLDLMLSDFQRRRLPHGGWPYALHREFGAQATPMGTVSRDPLIELLLYRAGRSDRERLRLAVGRYLADRGAVKKIVDTPDEQLSFQSILGYESPHTEPDGVAKYYLYFSTYWAARGIEALGGEEAKAWAALLAEKLHSETGADGSVADYAGTGRSYATADYARTLEILARILSR